jgi:pimeloyl-ACP methyl ester carboxylesterase
VASEGIGEVRGAISPDRVTTRSVGIGNLTTVNDASGSTGTAAAAGALDVAGSVYRTPRAAAEVAALYDRHLAQWPVPASELEVETHYGSVHVIASGPESGPPVLLLHAASMAAISWAPNMAALTDAGYRVYAPDHIGEAGKSRLRDSAVYPRTPGEVGMLYAEIAGELGIGPGPVVGASAGGHAALRYALAAPPCTMHVRLAGRAVTRRAGARRGSHCGRAWPGGSPRHPRSCLVFGRAIRSRRSHRRSMLVHGASEPSGAALDDPGSYLAEPQSARQPCTMQVRGWRAAPLRGDVPVSCRARRTSG